LLVVVQPLHNAVQRIGAVRHVVGRRVGGVRSVAGGLRVCLRGICRALRMRDARHCTVVHVMNLTVIVRGLLLELIGVINQRLGLSPHIILGSASRYAKRHQRRCRQRKSKSLHLHDSSPLRFLPVRFALFRREGVSCFHSYNCTPQSNRTVPCNTLINNDMLACLCNSAHPETM
jgi:hypothetical protein